MQSLKDRIRQDGEILEGGILKIDDFLNHQLDPSLMCEIGEVIAAEFKDSSPDRILTAEVSGIAPALTTGLILDIPVVYARKHKPVTMYGVIYLETAPSPTKGGEVQLMAAAEYLPKGERVLIIDDFLASGKTLIALGKMAQAAELEIVGLVAIVEKIFQNGRSELQKKFPQVPILVLASITALSPEGIIFADD